MIGMASHRPASLGRAVNPADRAPIFPAIAEAWRELRKGFIDSYRPELHYMRGPGPKWREKHGAAQATRSGAVVGSDASRLLCRLAQRVLGDAGCEGGF